jgi:hypothetical protein
MPLTLRSTKLAPPVYEHIGDYEVLDDGQPIGRIYEIRAPLRPDELWSWSIMVLGAHRAGIETVGRTATFEDAKEKIKANYERWKAGPNSSAQNAPRSHGLLRYASSE